MKIQIKTNAPVGFIPGSIIYTDFESGIGMVRSGFATLLDANDHVDPLPVSIAGGVELEFKNDSGNPLPVSNTGIFAVQPTDANGKPTSAPDFWDVTTSTTIVYQGWKSGANVILSKTDLSAGTRLWALDSWANRVTATYV